MYGQYFFLSFIWRDNFIESSPEDKVLIIQVRTLPPVLQVSNHMNREAIHQMTGLPDEDVIFVRFQNEGGYAKCLPYYIACDPSTRSVVLAIRGTLSMEDMVTDMLCEPASLDDWIRTVSRVLGRCFRSWVSQRH